MRSKSKIRTVVVTPNRWEFFSVKAVVKLFPLIGLISPYYLLSEEITIS